MAKPYIDGIAVHKYMEAMEPPEDKNPNALLAARLMYWAWTNNIDILHTEFHFKGEAGGSSIHGYIDAIARMENGEEVLIDWKTASAPWKRIETGQHKLAPQAFSLQGELYLSKPNNIPNDLKGWPKSMMYVVVPKNGGAIETHTYISTDNTRLNLLQLLEIAELSASHDFPKNPGYQCLRCDVRDICWEAPGWEKNYEHK